MAKKKPAKKAASKAKAKPAAKKAAKKSSAKKPVAKAKLAKKAAPKKAAVKPKPVSKPVKKAVAKKTAAKKPVAKASVETKSAKSTATKVVAGAVAAAAIGAAARKVLGGATKSVSKKATLLDVTAQFSPLDDRVIIEVGEPATRTAGGLFIPDTVEDDYRPKQGVVVAVGRGHLGPKGRLQPLDVQLGDTVLFETYMGSPIMIGDKELVVLRESHLLGIVKGT